jgi:hypothetical protein
MVKLRRRLARFAPAPAVVVLEGVLAGRSAEAAPLPSMKVAVGPMAEATGARARIESARVIGAAEEVVRMMFLEKARIACVVSVAVLAACAAGVLGSASLRGAEKQDPPTAAADLGGAEKARASRPVPPDKTDSTVAAPGNASNKAAMGAEIALTAHRARFGRMEVKGFRFTFTAIRELDLSERRAPKPGYDGPGRVAPNRLEYVPARLSYRLTHVASGRELFRRQAHLRMPFRMGPPQDDEKAGRKNTSSAGKAIGFFASGGRPAATVVGCYRIHATFTIPGHPAFGSGVEAGPVEFDVAEEKYLFDAGWARKSALVLYAAGATSMNMRDRYMSFRTFQVVKPREGFKSKEVVVRYEASQWNAIARHPPSARGFLYLAADAKPVPNMSRGTGAFRLLRAEYFPRD